MHLELWPGLELSHPNLLTKVTDNPPAAGLADALEVNALTCNGVGIAEVDHGHIELIRKRLASYALRVHNLIVCHHVGLLFDLVVGTGSILVMRLRLHVVQLFATEG